MRALRALGPLVAGCAGCTDLSGLVGPGGPPDAATDRGADSAQPPSDAGGDAERPASSCNALLSANPRLKNKDSFYTLALDGKSVEVWCDMTLDGGGWTLVGRSVNAALLTSGFGWQQVHGDVHDDTQPYSLGAALWRVEIGEIAFGAYSAGKRWGPNVYKLRVPTDFYTAYPTRSFAPPGGPVTVLGPCAPTGGPTMLQFVGETADADHFHFRDNTSPGGFGLFSDGWATNGQGSLGSCAYTGAISGMQGMIAIR